MKNTIDKHGGVQIIYPSILLIPFLSIVFSIIKYFNGFDGDWTYALVFYPVLTYFMICFGWTVLAILGALLLKISRNIGLR